MKKVYMTPELEEIKIMNMNLLAGSVGADGLDGFGGYGGDGDGKEPEAPELPGMPDFSPNKLLGFPF